MLSGVENDEMTDRTAAAQLAALQADRVRLAERVVQPWWYDALLGLVIAAFLASYSLRSTWVTVGALVLLVLAMRGMIALYTRLTGLWVHGFRKGSTRRAIHVW